MRFRAQMGGGTFAPSTWKRSRTSARPTRVAEQQPHHGCGSWFSQLDQHAASGGRMQECDVLAFGANAWRLVDETNASGATALERPREVIDDKTDMVNAGPAFGDEFAYG